VGIEHFVDDYFSVEKFKKAYARRVEQLGDRSFWSKVQIAADVGAPIGKDQLADKGKIESRDVSRGEVERSPRKLRKMICGKFKCPNCDELGHRKNSPKCPLNGTKKRQVIHMIP
jgi:hypothetical protein